MSDQGKKPAGEDNGEAAKNDAAPPKDAAEAKPAAKPDAQQQNETTGDAAEPAQKGATAKSSTKDESVEPQAAQPKESGTKAAVEDKPVPAAKPAAATPTTAKPAAAKPAAAPPAQETTIVHVAPSPHVADTGLTTGGLMLDVVLGLGLVVVASIWYFRWDAARVLAITTVACMAFEWIFVKISGRIPTLEDMSAVVTGLILGLSLPWSTPWWICVIASAVAMGAGKVAFGSLGQNIFNPAMVGRAFVMISFSSFLGAGAYKTTKAMAGAIITQATPLTAMRAAVAGSVLPIPDLWFLFIGNTNGSLGETSALACLLGGFYLCFRRTASWEIPAAMTAMLVVLAGGTQLLAGPHAQSVLPTLKITVLQHLLSGAFMFGAFFIATDPVTSPLSRAGKFWFGAGISFFIWVLRTFSNYPEGLMFAVLLMNAAVPLINRWTVPVPVGGPVPERK